MALKETWDEPQEWFLQPFSVKCVGVLYLFYSRIPKLDYNISCKDFIVTLYVISCYIRPCYKDVQLYAGVTFGLSTRVSDHQQIICGDDDDIKLKHFRRYCPFVWGIRRSPVNSPRKGQWGGALMFSLICAWTNVWINNRYAGHLRRHRAHYDVTVMIHLQTHKRVL